jgi:hypothetical protein
MPKKTDEMCFLEVYETKNICTIMYVYKLKKGLPLCLKVEMAQRPVSHNKFFTWVGLSMPEYAFLYPGVKINT